MTAARLRSVAALVGLAAFFATLTLALVGGGPGAGAAGTGQLVAQPSLGAPARTFLGASPQEAPGEVWAVAQQGQSLARYTTAGGWEVVPAPLTLGGEAGVISFEQEGASVGRTTPAGGVAAIADGEEGETLVVRDPGGSLREVPRPGGLLEFEQQLVGTGAGRLLAATEGAGGRTMALVVPELTGTTVPRVLAYNGEEWAAEEICLQGPGCTSPEASFRVVAIDAGGGEAWLLGRGGAAGEGIELFRREGTVTPVWRQQPLGPAASLGARYGEEAPLGVGVAARGQGQPLTVTAAGVWFDAVLTEGGGAKHEATAYYDAAKGEVTASWCDLAAPAGLCTLALGSELPDGEGRSFAWPPSSAAAAYGARVVTGVGQGVILGLEGSAFVRNALGSGDAGSELGAALSAPDEGWLGSRPPLQLTRNPEVARLQPWPVPFRRPLTAIAASPGVVAGALGSEALAVGDEGEVARYVPGQGWEPEFLLKGNGKRATPRLRAVAWPEPGRAYAVGDGAAMWVWQKATGLWQSDPAASPNLARANFTGIAFDPAKPSRGYAVGKQGVLLGYGRQWKQEALPAGVPAEANFTSIAFAGDEAFATWKYPKTDLQGYTAGGVIVNDGSGWRVDDGAMAALAGSPPQRVAGLPDGGAVIASLGNGEATNAAGRVIERQGPGGAWQLAPGSWTGYPTALAAIREGGQVRAIAAIADRQGQEDLGTDVEQIIGQPPPGQAPLLTAPYPLPGAGAVIRQTATGWRDEQREGFPEPRHVEGQGSYDLPRRADPVLALLVSPDGTQGWAVGGETGTFVTFRSKGVQTAGVMRYGQAAAPPANAAGAAIPTEAGTATLALGGNAQCASACADLSGAGIGPDRWLGAAVGKAATIPGTRAFLYTGSSVAAGEGGVALGESLSAAAFAREEEAYARRLAAGAGALPTFAAPAASDLDSSGSLDSFAAAFAGFGAPLGSGPAGAGIVPVSLAGPGQAYYSFDSTGSGGSVRVVVLDYSAPELGAAQRCWLSEQLANAGAGGTPAIVVGQRDLAGIAANAATDRGQVVPILAGASAPPGCGSPGFAASAYFFDFPEQTRAYRLIAGARSIPAYGTGTLGYVTPPAATETDFVGSSGFLLAAVGLPSGSGNVAPVGVRLIPAIGSLALNPTDGTLLRRSQPALFEALARRPLAGTRCEGGNAPKPCEFASPEPYVQIPSQCLGSKCATTVLPDYAFTSSEPDIADFVAPDPASTNPRNVLLVKKKPVLDPHSGLLCAFNAGTTIVTVATGGLSYSQKVTVQAGSVQQPCGTTPLRNRAGPEPAVAPPPAPAPAPGPASPAPTPAFPPPPSPAVPTATPAPPQVAHPAAPAPAPASPFFQVPPQPALPVIAIVPPPLPAVQPTPPSGTSQVQATEKEEEEEEAYDTVASMARLPAPGPARVPVVADDDLGGGGSGGVPALLPALILIAALAAAGVGGRRRGGARPAFQSTQPTRRYR
ncbi:MAG TPA: hypothetical protein VFJ57_15275 [Solirubrobacterales bacterium]|nr:hypothetical protein [Solirubrobacterales bacterium]